MSYLFLLVVLVQPTSGYSAPVTLWDANKLLSSTAVSDLGKPLELRDGALTGFVRIDYLRTLVEAHERLVEVSKVNASLVIVVDKDPQATAVPAGMIIFTTGMLNIVGADQNMTAAVMAHEFAHLSLRHAFQSLLKLPSILRSGSAVAGAELQQTGDRYRAARVAGVTMERVARSYSREQETEADRVGTEFLARAKYEPGGMLRFIDALYRSKFIPQKTDYRDTHPGYEERLANAKPTVANQRYAAVAAILVENKNWRRLTELVSPWLKTSPDSAHAWYYHGVSLRELHKGGALQAFARGVRHDPSFTEGWLALCIELYRAGEHRNSLVCAEHLPLNEMRDEFAAKTFQHPIYVGGMNPRLEISDEDALIISRILGRPDLAPRSAREREREQREQDRIARQSAVEQQQIDNLRLQCERHKKLPIGPRRDELVTQACDRYDAAVRRQAYGALNRQQAR